LLAQGAQCGCSTRQELADIVESISSH
jgi:hypothetical protein